MTPNSKTPSEEDIIQKWRDYEGNVVRERKLYEDAIKKEKPLSELGPASKALLERVNTSFGNITIEDTIVWAKRKTKLSHDDQWWYRRLVALALEGYIDTRVYRTGDKITILFRKKKEAGG